MNGVSIGQVRPVVKKGQAYVPRPPRLMTDTIRSDYGGNSAGLTKGHKSDRRPVSGFQNAGTKRKIARNAADLKDLLFNREQFSSGSKIGNRTTENGKFNLQLPISNV